MQNNQLKKDLRKILRNNICKYQSLDAAADRSRVVDELIKELTKNYIWLRIITPK